MLDFTVTLSGTMTLNERDAAIKFIDEINARRTEAAANADPPEEPVLLPKSTNQEIRDGYKFYLEQLITKADRQYAKKIAEQKRRTSNIEGLWINATQAQRDAAITALGG